MCTNEELNFWTYVVCRLNDTHIYFLLANMIRRENSHGLNNYLNVIDAIFP